MILTPLEPEDLELLYTIENEPALWNAGNTNVPYSRYALRNYISTQQHDIYADKQVRLVARVEEEEGKSIRERAVGLVDLFNFSPEHQRAEIGFAVLKEEQGKGYGRQALRLLVEYAQKVLHLHVLYAVVAADNAASLATLRSEDFAHERLLRDWVMRADGCWEDAVFLQRIL